MINKCLVDVPPPKLSQDGKTGVKHESELSVGWVDPRVWFSLVGLGWDGLGKV